MLTWGMRQIGGQMGLVGGSRKTPEPSPEELHRVKGI